MRIVFSVLTVLFVCVGMKGQIYNNFIEAGKSADKDMDYRLASYFYEEALRNIPRDSIVDRYFTVSRLRDTNKNLGQYDKAIDYGRESLKIMRFFGEAGNHRRMEDYVFMADIYLCKKDREGAECYMDSALKIADLSDLNTVYKKRFATLAGIFYSHIGNWQKAESWYGTAVKFSERYPVSDDTQRTLNTYGNALYHNGKFEEALEVYEKQRTISEQLHGRDSREYQWANNLIANILAYMGRIDEGSRLYLDVMEWYRDKITHGLQSAPGSSRESYLENMIEILRNSISFGIEAKYNADEFTARAYDALLFTKGLLLATEKSTETIIREKGTPEEREALETLRALRSQLSDMLADSKSDPKDVLNTYAKIKGIDYELANACAGYGNNTSFSAIGYEQIKRNLKENEVLLDFADFKPLSKPRKYVCYEIRRDQKYPKVHYVCNGAELDSLLTLENHVWSNLYTGESGDAMEAIVGNRLKRIVGEAQTVYYVPSGIFHKLAIEAIPDGDDLLGDRRSFHRLSSARELATSGETGHNLSARLYGGLNYSSEIKKLSHSLEEVNEISATLGRVTDPITLIGDDGTRESFMGITHDSPSIIHLSTHGFYYTPDDRDLPATLSGYDDAMKLSGLVMSGGSISERKELLTADDVSRCDLSGTVLASLASCHSGQGEVTSEGIYGLQRAFKKAGVRTIVMNLWEASDVAAKCFMDNFYSDLVNGSKDRHQAFRFARDEVRKQYPSPFYWAGFVMVD